MKRFRLNRLFNPKSQRCFDVAVDHGFFNEPGFLGGIENLEKAIETLVGANPDAIQLTVGQAEVLQRIPGKQKPALVLRTDVANVYGRVLPRARWPRGCRPDADRSQPLRRRYGPQAQSRAARLGPDPGTGALTRSPRPRPFPS